MLEQTPPLRKGKPQKGFPKKVTILGQTWNVAWCANLKEDRGALGVTVSDQRLIIMDSSQSRESATDVLIHECLHACLSSGHTWNLPDEFEENLVRHLTPAVLSLVRDTKPWWH